MNALHKKLENMSISEFNAQLHLEVHNPINTESGKQKDMMDLPSHIEGV